MLAFEINLDESLISNVALGVLVAWILIALIRFAVAAIKSKP